MDVLSGYLAASKFALVALAALIALSGLDDLFIDSYYLYLRLRLRMLGLRKRLPLRADVLKMRPEQAIAVMIPAWREGEVIGAMLEHLLAAYRYDNFQVFVGVYPNDPQTASAVGRVAASTDRVRSIPNPRPGPTSKGDCLNAILRGIKAQEASSRERFALFVLHDAEDVVHPLELQLFNAFIPANDMAQLPVLPLERPWRSFTGGHYLDEFAENHTKDLAVRERLTGYVPSAGVACAFSAHAMDRLAEATGAPFDAGSLTEDYEIGIRLAGMGLSQVFLRFGIERSDSTGPGIRLGRLAGREFVATREYFPNRLRDACRQKARWLLGISFQGWRTFGWRGDWRRRYALWRDRKGLIAGPLAVLGYAVLLNGLAASLVAAHAAPASATALFAPGDPLWTTALLSICSLLLLNRAAHRVYFVWLYYGAAQAALSLPRQIWGNVVNCLASLRALGLFAAHVRSGQPIAWDKTAHVFPTDEELAPFRRRLGELLLHREHVSRDVLDAALQAQRSDERPLGTLLLDAGHVDEDKLFQTLAEQLGLPLLEVDPLLMPSDLIRLVPRSVAAEYSIVPVGRDESGRMMIASDRLIPERVQKAIEARLGESVSTYLATRSDVAAALRWGYDREADPFRNESVLSLLSQNLERGALTASDIRGIRRRQRRAYRSLGSILVRQGRLRPSELEAALKRMAEGDGRSLGAFLVAEGTLSEREIDGAMAEQSDLVPSLATLLPSDLALVRRDRAP